jgi:hypothetical protein
MELKFVFSVRVEFEIKVTFTMAEVLFTIVVIFLDVGVRLLMFVVLVAVLVLPVVVKVVLLRVVLVVLLVFVVASWTPCNVKVEFDTVVLREVVRLTILLVEFVLAVLFAAVAPFILVTDAVVVFVVWLELKLNGAFAIIDVLFARMEIFADVNAMRLVVVEFVVVLVLADVSNCKTDTLVFVIMKEETFVEEVV